MVWQVTEPQLWHGVCVFSFTCFLFIFNMYIKNPWWKFIQKSQKITKKLFALAEAEDFMYQWRQKQSAMETANNWSNCSTVEIKMEADKTSDLCGVMRKLQPYSNENIQKAYFPLLLFIWALRGAAFIRTASKSPGLTALADSQTLWTGSWEICDCSGLSELTVHPLHKGPEATFRD